MPGYMLTTASGDDWAPVPIADFAEVFQPRSLECETVAADGDYAFRTGAAEVSASWELAGVWAVHIEGAVTIQEADAIAEEMAQQLGAATGETANCLRVMD